MHETIQGRPSELVFNLDEVGISDWEDRRPKMVVGPITARAHNIHHRIPRNVKHISIVTLSKALDSTSRLNSFRTEYRGS
jgi:DNA polymerase III psi subunit